jgi:hypothetical protein
VAAEAVRLSVASEEVEASEEAEVLAAAASEEEWAEAAVPAPGSKTRNNQIINFNKKNKKHEKVNYHHLSRCGYPCYMGSKCI